MSNIYIQEPQTHGKVLLQTTVGEIDIELWAKETPKACRNFVQLCLEGYYDTTIFHRLVKGFIVQGGDPTGTGSGGESIYGEPFKDEFHSRLRFVRRGLVAMANAGKDDNGSQFFFTLGPASELQGKHTIFGKVTGNTLYNMLKLEESLVGGNERPVCPHKIIKCQVLSNPFPDIVPRKLVKQVQDDGKGDKKMSQSKATKNFQLLSFGDEAEEDEAETDALASVVRGRSKSSHDLARDPKLSSVPAIEVPEEAKKSPTPKKTDSGSSGEDKKPKQEKSSPAAAAAVKKENGSESAKKHETHHKERVKEEKSSKTEVAKEEKPKREERSKKDDKGDRKKEEKVDPKKEERKASESDRKKDEKHESKTKKEGSSSKKDERDSDKSKKADASSKTSGSKREEKATEETSSAAEQVRKKLKKEDEKKPAAKAPAKEQSADEVASLKKEVEELRKQLEEVKKKENTKPIESVKEKEVKKHKDKKKEVMKEYASEISKYEQQKKSLKRKADREAETLAALEKFKSKIKAEKERKPSDSKEESEDTSWMTHTLKFDENEVPEVLAKDASTKDDNWYDISDPRNALNKRRRETAAPPSKSKESSSRSASKRESSHSSSSKRR